MWDGQVAVSTLRMESLRSSIWEMVLMKVIANLTRP